MTAKPRVAPLPPAQWSSEARDAYAILEPSGTNDLGAASSLVRTLAHYPQLAKPFFAMGRHLLLESSLPHRLRELVTLRIAWRLKSGYEWHHHVRFGQQIGLSDEEIEAVKQGPRADIWDNAERCVLRLTDELYDRSKVDDELWRELSQILDLRQIMDLVFTASQYVMVAWAVEAFGLGLEHGFESKEHKFDPPGATGT